MDAFKSWLDTSTQLIDEAKSYSEFDQQQQKLFDQIQKVSKLQKSDNPQQLVSSMIDLAELLEEMEDNSNKEATIQQLDALSLIKSKASRVMEDVVTDLAKD